MSKPLSVIKTEAMVRAARVNLVAFVLFMFPPGSGYTLGKLHRYLAETAQDMMDNILPPRLGISTPPQHGKSRMMAVRFVAWLLGRYPGISVAITGAVGTLVAQFSKEVRGIVTDPKYALIFPNIKPVFGSNSATHWRCTNGSEMISRAAGSKLVGRRVDCLVGSTIIETSEGQRTIKEIASAQQPVNILSYESGKPQWRKVEAVANRAETRIFRITTRSGRMVEASGTHPFLSGGRWVDAAELAPGDDLLCIVQKQEDNADRRFQESNREECKRGIILLTEMRRSISKCIIRKMQAVWGKAATWKKILFGKMFNELPAISEECDKGEKGETMQSMRGDFLCPKSNCATMQQKVRGARSFDGDAERCESELARRCEQVTKKIGKSGGVSEDAACRAFAGWERVCDLRHHKESSSASYRSQVHEQSSDEFSDAMPQVPRNSAWGRSKETETDYVALVEEIREEVTVYNLQVQGTESFFANGILTHNCLIIDDPHAGREEAESALQRERIKDWYFADCYTRLSPGAKVLCIACMTGDTPVLMEDSTEKPLRDIRPGDRVATYDNGKISSATVLNWKNQGEDFLLEIHMSSGIVVRANARHPFLVRRGNQTKWIKTQNLKNGDHILRVTPDGELGKASPAPQMNAKGKPSAKGCAKHITANTDGAVAIIEKTLKKTGRRSFATDTASNRKNTLRGSKTKKEGAQFAGSFQPQMSLHIGKENCALTTTTIPKKSGGYSATIATLLLGREEQQRFSYSPLNTLRVTEDQILEIKSAGREDVFDIQVERTENFIANGLVSHNTRWHPQDLIGHLTSKEYVDELKLLDQERECFYIVNLPAICEHAEIDPLGREDGEALCPELGRDEKFLAGVRAAIPAYDWRSLYQGDPTPKSGGEIEVDKITLITPDKLPPMGELEIARGWDLAITEDQAGCYSTGGLVAYHSGSDSIYVLGMWRKRLPWPKLKKEIIAQALSDKKNWGVETVGIENVSAWEVARSEVRTALLGEVHVRGVPAQKSKLQRAQPWIHKVEAGRFYMLLGNWNRDLIEEMQTFPSGNYDDMIDAITTATVTLFRGRATFLAA